MSRFSLMDVLRRHDANAAEELLRDAEEAFAEDALMGATVADNLG